MTPNVRGALLQDLAGLVCQYVYSTNEGGLAAMLMLRSAGATWSDLLGPPLDRDGLEAHSYAMALATYGHRPMPSMQDCGRAVLTVAHTATAYELARTVAFVHSVPLASPACPTFAGTVRDLLRRAQLETVEAP